MTKAFDAFEASLRDNPPKSSVSCIHTAMGAFDRSTGYVRVTVRLVGAIVGLGVSGSDFSATIKLRGGHRGRDECVRDRGLHHLDWLHIGEYICSSESKSPEQMAEALLPLSAMLSLSHMTDEAGRFIGDNAFRRQIYHHAAALFSDPQTALQLLMEPHILNQTRQDREYEAKLAAIAADVAAGAALEAELNNIPAWGEWA